MKKFYAAEFIDKRTGSRACLVQKANHNQAAQPKLESSLMTRESSQDISGFIPARYESLDLLNEHLFEQVGKLHDWLACAFIDKVDVEILEIDTDRSNLSKLNTTVIRLTTARTIAAAQKTLAYLSAEPEQFDAEQEPIALNDTALHLIWAYGGQQLYDQVIAEYSDCLDVYLSGLTLQAPKDNTHQWLLDHAQQVQIALLRPAYHRDGDGSSTLACILGFYRPQTPESENHELFGQVGLIIDPETRRFEELTLMVGYQTLSHGSK